jgi:hypothetical protein
MFELKFMPTNITDLQVLALDCQATGANPQKGHLLEIAWLKTSASDTRNPSALPVKSYLASLPEDVEIPPAVQRVTGISKEALGKTLTPTKIWQKVCKTANQIAAAGQMDNCPPQTAAGMIFRSASYAPTKSPNACYPGCRAGDCEPWPVTLDTRYRGSGAAALMLWPQP